MQPGESLDGRYTIVSRVGEGGMGEVYKATHDFLGATRVIKIVRPQISGSEDARERFLREARMATKVQHPNVATLHDFASLPGGAHYMVWEFIEGENLAQRLRSRGTFAPREAIEVSVQALRGLEAIHRAGIVHRDISPENLMIGADGNVKIIDLGVAKIDDPAATAKTATGMFVGKLRYASPEQLGFLPEDEKIDGRTDLYAMGMVLVELLTGRPPYEAKSPHEYFLMHARDEHKKTIDLPAQLPGGEVLHGVLQKALSRDRNDRYETAREFADALEAAIPMLVDAPAATVVLPLPDAPRTTMRETRPALSQETIRTPQPAETVRTTVGPTVGRRRMQPALIAAIVAALLFASAAVVLWLRSREQAAGVTPITAQAIQRPAATQTTALPPQEAGTSLTVTTPATASPVELTAPVSTSTPPRPDPAASAPKPLEPRPSKLAPAPTATHAVEPAQEEPAETLPLNDERFGSLPVYVDGGPDGDANDRALELLRQKIRGTREVTLSAGAMQAAVEAALKESLPEMKVVERAAVSIRFEGILERQRLGRKRRAATAVVFKDHKPVFRYVLPDEVYRVGMTPAEAFANVFSDAVE